MILFSIYLYNMKLRSEKEDRNSPGGESQRIAIARALLRDPSVFIMDEATSALDLITEQKIYENIHSFMHSRLTLLVSHRPSNLRWAEHIVVLEKGSIAEQGGFEELLQKQGMFITTTNPVEHQ